MATQYRISATAHAPERTMNNRKSAITEAENRARYAKYEREVIVTTVATGKVVHTVAARPVPANVPAAPSPRYRHASQQAAIDAAVQPAPRQRRTALAPAAQHGWVVLYDKPRAGYQVWRATAPGGGYALWCPKHEHLHQVRTLAAERAARLAGGWCTGCTAPAPATTEPLRAEHTRASLPTQLRAAGITWEQVHDEQGLMQYVIDGETMTPGQAAERYLR